MQLRLEVLITDAGSDEGCQPSVDNVVVDVETTRLDEGILLDKNSLIWRTLNGQVPAESRVAKHEITVDTDKIIEMIGDAKTP